MPFFCSFFWSGCGCHGGHFSFGYLLLSSEIPDWTLVSFYMFSLCLCGLSPGTPTPPTTSSPFRPPLSQTWKLIEDPQLCIGANASVNARLSLFALPIGWQPVRSVPAKIKDAAVIHMIGGHMRPFAFIRHYWSKDKTERANKQSNNWCACLR